MRGSHHHRHHLGAALVLVCLGVTAGGCDSAGGGGGPFAYSTPALDAVPLVDASVRLPISDYELPGAERTRMQDGETRLLERCMAERGFAEVEVGGDFTRPLTRPGFESTDVTMWGGPFGTMPLEHARRFGYKPEPGGPFVKGPGFYLSDLSNRYAQWGPEGTPAGAELAFYGVDTSNGVPTDEDAPAAETPGCLEEVGSRLGKLVDTTEFRADMNELARQHPRVEQAMQAWTDCMRDRGYPFSKVWEGNARYSMSAVNTDQIKTAVDDVECTDESEWANYFYAALADYQHQALEHDPALMESALEGEKARLAAVERELAR